MADNRIDLVAGLNISDSAEQINKTDIPTLEKQLKGIKIQCELDTKGLKSIQNSLNKVSDNVATDSLKISSIVDSKETKKVTNSIVDAFNDAFGMIGKMGETTKKEFNAQTKQMLQEFKDSYFKGLSTGDFSDYTNILDKLEDRIREFNKGDIQQLKNNIAEIRSLFTDGSKVSIGENLKGWLDYRTGSNSLSRQYLDAIYGKGNYTIGKGNVSADTLFKADEDMVESIVGYAEEILEYQNKIRAGGWGLDEVEHSVEDVLQVSQEIEDKIRRIVGLSAIDRSGEFVQILNADEGIDNITSQADVIKTVYAEGVEQSEKLHRAQVMLQQDYNKLKATIDKTHQSIKIFSQVDNQDQDAIFNSLMSSPIGDWETLNRARDALTMIRKEFQLTNASMVSDIPSNVLEGYINRVAKLDSQLRILKIDFENLDHPSDKLTSDFEKLVDLSAKFDFSPDIQVGSREELTERVKQYTEIKILLNDVQSQVKAKQKAEADFNKEFNKELQIEKSINKEKEKAFNKEFAKALKEEEKEIELKQKELELIRQIKNEQAQTYNQSTSDYWQGNFNEQSQKDYWDSRRSETIKAMTAENQVLKDMRKYYEDIEKTQKEIFRDDNRQANLQNRIKRLTADVNNYAAANQRAVNSTKEMTSGKSFADEFARISSAMAKGVDLTDREVKDLSADFAVLKKEASAAGLQGSSAFGKFLGSFKTMSTYVTANMVFNFVKRQLQQMAQEVINIDTAMVELRKVTEATDAEFEQFAESAAKTGRQLGASISEVINATSEFARAGFNLPDAEELGKIATLYKNVGDGIGIDDASETIVSVVKAFNIEAQNSIEVIDKINEVSNRAAIDSGGLGFALKRVASAMESANNTLDETIALTATANEIVQNPEMVSQGWRTVALRIRGAKTELEEAGEDTEGMVESTAKLRDLIKGVSGVDIMIDANTFKSTYQIIDELGRVWKDINDIDQAAILEAIAGKRQSNIVAATLNNYERLEEILRISKDSAGSAMKEQQEYAKSIQYSLDRAKAAYQGLAQTIIDSDVLKYLVDMSAALLTNINAIFSVSGLLKDNAFVSLGGFVNSFFENENRIDDIVENMRVLSKDAELFAEDFTTVNKIIEEYGNIINSSNYNKSDLVKLQDDLIASFGEEAKSIDIVNGKYKDVILSINELVSIKYQDWLEENAHIVELAEKYSNMYVDWEWNPGDELFEIKNVSKDLRDIISNIEGVNAFEGFLSDDILFTGNIRDVKNELDELIKSYDNYESKDDLTLNKLKERQKVLSEIIGYIDTYSQQNALKELSDIESEIVEKNIDITKTIYGNIDTNNRQVLKWTDENLLKYKNAIESWGMSTEELAGDISTILGSYGNYDNIDIAFSPILQTPDGAVLLSRDTVDKYIFGLIEQAGEGWTDEELFRLDTKGIEVDGIKIKNIIAEVGDAAEKTSEAMHYVGSSGALALAKQKAGLKSLSESSEGSVLYNLKAIKEETDNLSNTWFETLDKVHKESFKTISNVKTLLQSVAEGNMLSGDDFWNLVKIDTDNIIKDVELINDKFKISENQLIQLKDIYIQKQIDSIKADNADLEIKKQQTDEKSKQAELDLQVIGRRGLSNASYRQQYEYTKNALAEAKQSSKEYAETINRNKILIRQLNSELGDTVDRQKALSEQMKKLQDQADKYAKAMTDAVQNVIGGLEDEKQQLEDEKQILDDQLDVLNERKESIEETIEQYKSLAGIVKDVTDAEIDVLKEQQQAEEDAIQARVDALKEQHDMQEEENSLAEKELELRKKLADLDKAKSTKVRTYSAERGWHFDVDKEAVANAQTAADEAQKAYDDAISDKEYNNQIKSLEAEKKAVAKNYEAEIKSYEDYYKEWSDITEEQSKAEEEQLAQQILGSDWREKIKAKDSNALAKFASDFRGYNAQLNSLVNGEIASLKKSIEAKEDEINAKNKQIDAWKRYKTQVENTIDDITNKYKDYTDVLGAATAAEGDSYETREEKLRNFATQYESLIGEINGYQSQIEGLTIPVYLDDKDAREKIGTLLDDYANAMSEMSRALEDTPRSMHKWVDDLRNIYGFSQGGVADFTGVTIVHGTKQRSETIFNASQSKMLYDMVKSGSFVNVVADKAYAGLSSAISKMSSTTDNSNRVININGLTIKADTPMQFHNQFMKEIGQYWNVKLTEVRTR